MNVYLRESRMTRSTGYPGNLLRGTLLATAVTLGGCANFSGDGGFGG
jgi:hypothetical protein